MKTRILGRNCDYDQELQRLQIELVAAWASAPKPNTWSSCIAAQSFERMRVRAGIVLIKYWFSVSHEEQERRFQDRMKDATKR